MKGGKGNIEEEEGNLSVNIMLVNFQIIVNKVEETCVLFCVIRKVSWLR